jgi:molecular chaperone GrpE
MKKAHKHETADREEPVQPEPGTPEHSGAPEPQMGGDGPAEPAYNVTPGGDDLARELSELRDRHLRLAAEYDNYRRRVERERVESRTRAQAELVERLLDSLDDLQRVAHYTPESASAEALLEGARMVERKLLRALEAAGMEPVEAEGQPFNPEYHEALTTVAAETREEDNAVADVFQKGYRFKGTLLRPARVRVKKYEG